MGGVGLGHHHQAGGVLVEPVHDAGPLDAADAGQAVAAMGDQRVDQRALGVAGGRMHHQARRLVDHDQRVVLVDDIERDRLARGLGRLGRRQRDGDGVAGFDVAGGIADRARRDRDLAVEDQRLQARARQRRDARGEHAVEPLAFLLGGDLDCLDCLISHGLTDVRRPDALESGSRRGDRQGAPDDDRHHDGDLRRHRCRARRHRLPPFPCEGKRAVARRRHRGAAGRRQGALDRGRRRPHRGDHRGRRRRPNCARSIPIRSSRSGACGWRRNPKAL